MSINQIMRMVVCYTVLVLIIGCGCREKPTEREAIGFDNNIDLFREQGLVLDEQAMVGQYEGITDMGCYLRIELCDKGIGQVLEINPYVNTPNRSVLTWRIEKGGVIHITAIQNTLEKNMEMRPIPPIQKQPSNRIDYVLFKAYGYDYIVNVYLIRSEVLSELRSAENWAGHTVSPIVMRRRERS